MKQLPTLGDIFKWTMCYNNNSHKRIDGICCVFNKTDIGFDVFDIMINDYDFFSFADFEKTNQTLHIDYIFRCNESLDMIE